MVPWEYDKLLVCDATCTDTYAPSYAASATNEAGVVAAMAKATPGSINYFQPVAVETLEAFGPDTFPFL